MAITCDVPKELKDALLAEASKLGLSLSEYVRRVLSAGVVLANKPKTGAELVEYWQSEGLIGARPDIANSRTHARRMRRKAERRAKTDAK